MIKGAEMDCEYVKRMYGVPACIGRLITFKGKSGIIAEDRGHYIGVNFDEDKPGVIHNVHPTDGVEYGGMGKIRKMTRGQKRYANYLKVADCYDSFAEYLLSCQGS
jgi:hypothetical protein